MKGNNVWQLNIKLDPNHFIHSLLRDHINFLAFSEKTHGKNKQYFELCLSIFQDYPIGSVIVNNDKQNLSLLDGRQRRTCITKLFNDPTAVYEWAKDCCGFKNKASEDEVKERFWYQVEEYLGKDFEDIVYDNDDDDDNNEEDEDPIDDIDRKQASSDTERAMKSTSLEILLDYILLCHNKLMKAFDFSKVFSEKALNYYSKNKNNKFEVDPIKLSKHIRALNDDRDFKANNTLQHKESFMHYLTDRYDFRPDNAHASNNLAIHLNLYWDVIKSAFDVYAKIDKVLTDAEVGFIELNDATISDAQNVFSKINSGGTQLNAAELLSAKPYWNEPAEPNGSMKKAIDCLYKKLNTEIDTENKKYCRWDIPATLLQAIDPHNLFYKTTNADPSTDIDVNEISMGFKLLSSCYVGGMSKLSLDELEKAKKKDDNVKLLDWSDNLSSFIDSFKTMVDAIYKQTSFIIIPSWGLSIYDILGAGAAMELFAGAWLKWDGKISEKSFDSKDFKCFLNGFKNHFDRLVYEKMSGSYKGSGDARMARNLKNIDSRTALITTEEHARFNSLIQELCTGKLGGKEVKHGQLRPILAYEKIILNKGSLTPPNESPESFDIDHVFPRFMFESSNGLLNDYRENALCNLELLPNSLNKEKKNKLLDDKSFTLDQKKQLAYYDGISEEDFPYYSEAQHYNEFANNRTEKLLRIFNDERRKHLG